MAHAKFISEKALKFIRSAERATSYDNEADAAARFAFRQIRADGVLLSDILTDKAANQNVGFQPQSVLLMEKVRLAAEVVRLNSMVAKLDGNVSMLTRKVAKAQNDNAELRESNKRAKAKFSERLESASKASDAKIAAIKAELKSVRVKAAADLAAERAKPAPISADDWASLEKKARDQEAEIATLKEALAKAAVPPATAPAPSAPASATSAASAVSKGSQRALKAWVTRRAKAAAAVGTAAPAPAASISKGSQRALKAWVARRAKAAAAVGAALRLLLPVSPRAHSVPLRLGSLVGPRRLLLSLL